MTDGQWAQSFAMYAAIYPEKNPSEGRALITCMRYVDAMKKGLRGDWKWFDRRFRWDREHSGCPWRTYRLDLEMRSMQRTSYQAHSRQAHQRARNRTHKTKTRDKKTKTHLYLHYLK